MKKELEVLDGKMEAQKREVAALKKEFKDARAQWILLSSDVKNSPASEDDKDTVDMYHRAREDYDAARDAARDIQTRIRQITMQLGRLIGTP